MQSDDPNVNLEDETWRTHQQLEQHVFWEPLLRSVDDTENVGSVAHRFGEGGSGATDEPDYVAISGRGCMKAKKGIRLQTRQIVAEHGVRPGGGQKRKVVGWIEKVRVEIDTVNDWRSEANLESQLIVVDVVDIHEASLVASSGGQGKCR